MESLFLRDAKPLLVDGIVGRRTLLLLQMAKLIAAIFRAKVRRAITVGRIPFSTRAT